MPGMSHVRRGKDSASPCSPMSWSAVPNEVLNIIVSYLPHNEAVCNMQLVCNHWKSAFCCAGSPPPTILLAQSVPHPAFKRHWSLAAGNYKRLNREQKEKLMCLTAASGNLANLQVLIAMWAPTDAVLDAAAGAGQLDICVWLASQGCEGSPAGHIAVARGGHVHICKWWDEQRMNGDLDEAELAAARAGQFAVIDYFTERGKADGYISEHPGEEEEEEDVLGWGSGQVLAAFVEGCPLHVAQQAYGRFLEAGGRGWDVLGEDGAPQQGVRNRDEGKTKRLVTIAALASSTPDWRQKLAWLEGKGLCSVRGVGHVAARRVAGSRAQDAVERLQHLQHMLEAAGQQQQQQQQGVANNGGAADNNADRDSDDELEGGWGVGMGMEQWGPEDWDAPAGGQANGDGPPQGPIFNTGVLLQAVRKGDSRAVRYMLDNGVPSSRTAAQLAAEGGHLEVLKMLLSEPVEVIPWTLQGAAMKGRVEVVQWMVEAVSGLGRLDEGLMRLAAVSGKDELVRWLRARGCPWEAGAFAAAARACSEETVEWMAAEGCPMGPRGEAFAEAATVGDIPMLRTLLAVGCRWSETHSFAHCIYNCHVEGRCLALPALEWLLGQGLPVHVENAVAAARQRVEEGQPEELSEWVLAKWGRGVGEEVEWDEGEVSDGEAEHQEEYGDGGEEEEGESDEDEDEEGKGEDDEDDEGQVQLPGCSVM